MNVILQRIRRVSSCHWVDYI